MESVLRVRLGFSQSRTPRAPVIAIIDDDSDFLVLAKTVLEDEGYRVETLSLGTGAFQFVKERRPDLVILDLRLGDRSGWDVLQTFQLDPETSQVPVLVCSAAHDELHRGASHVQAVGGDVLRKPFTLDVLVDKVDEMLRGRPHGTP